jgi:two-component system, response regulator PdtaR
MSSDSTDSFKDHMDKPLHALVIEDELLIALDIEQQLKELGFATVDVATSEMEAIDLAQKRCPDLITADVELREGNGISAIRKICARRGQVPVIYITSRLDLLELVPDSIVVQKPFAMGKLRQAHLDAMGSTSRQ